MVPGLASGGKQWRATAAAPLREFHKVRQVCGESIGGQGIQVAPIKATFSPLAPLETQICGWRCTLHICIRRMKNWGTRIKWPICAVTQPQHSKKKKTSREASHCLRRGEERQRLGTKFFSQKTVFIKGTGDHGVGLLDSPPSGSLLPPSDTSPGKLSPVKCQ